MLAQLLRSLFARKPQAAALPLPADAAQSLAQAQGAYAAGRRADAVTLARHALALDPALAEARILLAELLREVGNIDAALEQLQGEPAGAQDAGVAAARHSLLGGGMVPMWHYSMLNDTARNAAYEAALRAVLKPADHVLEIGTGAGLLAMMAARAGAARVSTCEMVAPLAATAREIIAANGLAERIEVIACASTALDAQRDLGGRADVLVAEVIASDLLGEGMLDSFDDARERLLKPGARILPRGAEIRACLVASTNAARFLGVGAVAGFDMRLFNRYAPAQVFPDELGLKLDALSAPASLLAFDLQSNERIAPERRATVFEANADGACIGVLQWIRIELAAGICYENGMGSNAGGGHWKPILHPFAAPRMLRAGDKVTVVASHDRTSLRVYPA